MEPGKENNKMMGYLFSVDILIEEESNGKALEQLLHLLNSSVVKDYKIKNGIDLGKLIDVNLIENQKKNFPSEKKPEPDSQYLVQQLESFKQNSSLVRLTVIKGKGVTLNIPCRILNYDTDMQNVSVYHVDEKKVYLFKINEIDDFVIG